MKNNKPLKESVQEYARGIAGGLLFSFPLLYTMEVWWAGFIASSLSLFILVIGTFCILLGYNRYAGMRPDATWKEVMIDSIEEMGIGLILSTGILLILNRIQVGSISSDEMMGKIIIEAMIISIGVSIGTAQLGAGSRSGKEKDGKTGDSESSDSPSNNKMAVSVLAVCGAIIIGSNVAPTEEILLIAIEATPIHILLMALFSLTMSIVIVYFSNFRGTSPERPDNFIYELTFETSICYLIALGVAAFLLWFFDRFEGISLWVVVAQCVALGVLTSLGSSAGRLLIK